MNVAPVTMPRPPVRHVKAGSPDDNEFPCQWHTLEDERVSKAERQDRMPPVSEPAGWIVIALCLSPLLVIGIGALAGFALLHWK